MDARRRALQQWDRRRRSGCSGALCVTAVLVAAAWRVSGDFRRHVPETSIACVAPGQVRLRCRCMWLWYGLGSGDGLPVAVVWPCPWLCLWCPVTVTVAVAVCACGGARARVCLCVRVSVCERGFACACVCVAVWAGFVAVRVVCRVLRPLRTPGRPRAGAVTRSAQHAGHTLGTRASRNLDFGLEVRGERGRRVCRTSCVRVWSHAVQRVLCVFCVFCVSP
jgi:hypothetical protein